MLTTHDLNREQLVMLVWEYYDALVRVNEIRKMLVEDIRTYNEAMNIPYFTGHLQRLLGQLYEALPTEIRRGIPYRPEEAAREAMRIMWELEYELQPPPPEEKASNADDVELRLANARQDKD